MEILYKNFSKDFQFLSKSLNQFLSDISNFLFPFAVLQYLSIQSFLVLTQEACAIRYDVFVGAVFSAIDMHIS